MKEVKVLLYGTLRRGGALHKYVEPFKVSDPIEIPGIKMFKTTYDFPGAIVTGNAGDKIVAEIATVPKEHLKLLDYIEGCYYDPPLYKRKIIKVNSEDMFIYELNDEEILTNKVIVDWMKEENTKKK